MDEVTAAGRGKIHKGHFLASRGKRSEQMFNRRGRGNLSSWEGKGCQGASHREKREERALDVNRTGNFYFDILHMGGGERRIPKGKTQRRKKTEGKTRILIKRWKGERDS